MTISIEDKVVILSLDEIQSGDMVYLYLPRVEDQSSAAAVAAIYPMLILSHAKEKRRINSRHMSWAESYIFEVLYADGRKEDRRFTGEMMLFNPLNPNKEPIWYRDKRFGEK